MTMSKLAIRGGSREIDPERLPVWPQWDEMESAALRDVLQSGKWSRSAHETSFRQFDEGGGSQVEAFEERFCEFSGARHGIAVSSGTLGLEISLRSLGIGVGDEVIVPAYSAFATLSSVMCVGARPVFVDVNPANGNMDPSKIPERITAKTRAVVVVHFGGVPCAMEEIMRLTRDRGIFLIEDAAHAHGSQWQRQSLGTLANIGVFSFHQSKNLPCGEGGMIVTDDDQLAQTIRSIHDCGRSPGGKWYQHQRLGTNARLGEFQAALGLCQLTRLQEQLEKRQAMVEYFLGLIEGLSFLTPPALPAQTTACSFHILLLGFDSRVFHGISRHRLIAAANAEGLPCWPGYPKPLAHSKIADPAGASETAFPGAERLCARCALWMDHWCFLADQALVRSYANVFLKIDEHFSELSR